MKRFCIFFILIIIISIIFVFYIDKKITPIIKNYSISETKRVISIIVNRSINSDNLKQELNNLYLVIHKDEESIITLNSEIVNRLMDIISDECEDNLSLIEKKNYQLLKEKFDITRDYFLVPSGVVWGNSILSSMGFDIPISLKIIGNVSSGLNTEVKEYGLNNSLVIMSISVSLEVMVLLPFNSEIIHYNNDIPIMIKLIQGKVPSIYGFNAKEKNYSLNSPISNTSVS